MSLGLTFIPGSSVDPETGEIKDIELVKGRCVLNVNSAINRNTGNHAGRISGYLGEKLVCDVLDFTINPLSRGSDAFTSNGEKVEIKTCFRNNKIVLKKKQLDTLNEKDFYCIVFYKTTENRKQSYFFTNGAQGISGDEYFKRNIFFDSIFVFPKSLMVYYYNTSEKPEYTIKGTSVLYKTISFNDAKELFNLEELKDELGLKTYITERRVGKDIIDIYSIF